MPTKDTNEIKKLNTVIVDDDSKARKLLSILLKKFPQINVVGEASSLVSALDIIKKTQPDSVFLDIQLGTNSGFELLDKISNKAKVVFVSAYDDYALRAFEINALDYLKKPIEHERLAKTISRLMESNDFEPVHGINSNKIGNDSEGDTKSIVPSNKNITLSEAQNILRDALAETEVNVEDDEDDYSDSEKELPGSDAKKTLEYDDRLFITSEGVSKFIKISSIQCITAEKDYSYIYLVGGKKYLILKPMVEWEERLTAKYFVRIHRSTIVNLEYVEKVEKWFNASYHVFIQSISEPFQMSRRYASKLKERFK